MKRQIKYAIVLVVPSLFLTGANDNDIECPPTMTRVPEHDACIDVYEFPNAKGTKPVIGVSGLPIARDNVSQVLNAQALCESQGKRVCSREEWTAACRGQNKAKYPWGDDVRTTRDKSVLCNFARPYIRPNGALVAKRDERELARLWQGEPSGSRETCVSASGARDMIGNVEEWVMCDGPTGWCLMGRFWSHDPPFTCEMAVIHHSPHWQFYETGTRCCLDMDDVE